MKVRICYTVEVSEDERRAIEHYYGEYPDRDDLKEFFRQYGDGNFVLEDMTYDYLKAKEEGRL